MIFFYSWNRMQQIRQMRWEFGSILPADIKENLSDSEVCIILMFTSEHAQIDL